MTDSQTPSTQPAPTQAPPPAPDATALPDAAPTDQGDRTPLRTLLAVAGAALLLLTGIGIGVFTNLAQEAVDHHQHIVSALGFVAAVAIVMVVLLFVLKRLFVPAGRTAARRLLHRVTAAAEKSPGKPLSELVLENIKGDKRDAETLLAAFFLGRAYWLTLAALAGILGGSITAAQLMVLIQQTQRLTEQNQLIQIEAQLAARARQSELELQAAARAYDEITRIIDDNAAAGAIVYALDRLPEAMVMPVEIVDPAWSPTPNASTIKTRTVYPNLRPLAERLLMYAKSDRPSQGATWSVEEIGSVSTAIAHAFHRLGFGNATDTPEGGCVWHAIFRENGTPWEDAQERLLALRPDAHSPPFLARIEWTTFFESGSGRFARVDLRHLRAAQSTRLKLRSVKLPLAQLQGLTLLDVQLQCADLDGAWLQYTDLQGAQLQSASMVACQLQGANLAFARLDAADLPWAQLQGAFLLGARLFSANLEKAQLQGTHLETAFLAGANLQYASLGEDLVRFKLDSVRRVPLSGLEDEYGEPSNSADLLEVEFTVPAAFLKGAFFGNGIAAQVDHNYRNWLEEGVVNSVWWPFRREAELYLQSNLGESASVAISLLREAPPTNLLNAKTKGVLLARDTFSYPWSDTVTPDPTQAFLAPNTDPDALRLREGNPYRFPSWDELIRLAEEQAAERSASPPP